MQTIIGTDVSQAAQLLERGELVAIPTETVYGLAANALDERAIAKIYAVKNRPKFNPLIMHVASVEDIADYAFVSDAEMQLARKFMPGPLTMLLRKKENVPDLLTAGSDKVAVRVPAHPLTQQLLKQVRFPLAAPSANPSGYVSPTFAEHVWQGLNGKINYILDGGACKVGVESTIIECSADNIIVHRLGGLSIELLQGVSGLGIIEHTHEQKPATSGKLKSHYAPNAPLYLGSIDELLNTYKGKRIAAITLQPNHNIVSDNIEVFPLSHHGSLVEAAANLFSTLRLTDSGDYDVILAERMPEEGLGRAINDRLQRAQAQYKSKS